MSVESSFERGFEKMGAGQSMVEKKPLRDMVVLLPGITGSVLQKNGKDIWAPSGQAAWQFLTTIGSSLRDLQLLRGDPNGIVATRVVPFTHLIPGLSKIDGYTAVAQMFHDNFHIEAGSIHDPAPANFIEFPYDWRLDNRINAKRIAALLEDRLQRWRKHSYNPKSRVILVAHSMGGLIARYYLEVLEGWKTCKALITFGTPHRGSPQAVGYLANGYKKAFLDLTDIMRSFPSVHQLLPIYPMLWLGNAYARVAEAERVPGIDRAMALDALSFHREIEAKVAEHRRDADYMSNSYTTITVIGTRQPTLQSAVLINEKIELASELPAEMDKLLEGGDGTVPRASAIPIEMSDGQSHGYRDIFVPERHSSLQCNRSVLDDLQGRLEQMQVQGLEAIRAPGRRDASVHYPGLILELDDLYLPDERVIIRAGTVDGAPPAGPLRALIHLVEPRNGKSSQPHEFVFVETESGWEIAAEGLLPGLYRIQVTTGSGGIWDQEAVHDVFEVGGT